MAYFLDMDYVSLGCVDRVMMGQVICKGSSMVLRHLF